MKISQITISIRTLFAILVVSFLVACNSSGSGSGNSGGATNGVVFELSVDGTSLLLVRNAGRFLLYRKQDHFECYKVAVVFTIVSENDQSLSAQAPGGQIIDFSLVNNNTYVMSNNGQSLQFTVNGQVEADIQPRCGNAEAVGEVSVAITFQNLPDTIRRTPTDIYEWKVIFDMDDNMEFGTGDIAFQVSSIFGADPSAEQTSIEEIGADLFVYYDVGSTTGIGDISLQIDGNTMVLTAPKSLFTTLESITPQTQIHVSAEYIEDTIMHSDYLPTNNSFTAVMDTFDIADTMNDQSGTATFVDIINISVTVD